MSRLQRAALFSAVATALFLLWLANHIGGATVTLYVDDLGELAAAALASLACAWAARRGAGRAWRWLALWAGLWAAGEMVWSFYELVLKVETPFPSPADVGYLGAVPFALIGLFAFPAGRRLVGIRLRSLVDSLVIAAALVGLTWEAVLAPTVRDATSRFELVLGLAYPVTDLILIVVALSVAARSIVSQRRPLAILSVGIAALGAADCGFLALATTGKYGAGQLFDSAWVLGFLLVALAAVCAVDQSREEGVKRASPLIAWLDAGLYLPVALLLALAALEQVRFGRLHAQVVLTVIPVVALTLARQIIINVDNRRLAVRLQREVAGHRASEVELRAAEVRFRQGFEHSPVGMIITEPDGPIIDVNPALCSILARTRSDLLGMRPRDFIEPEDAMPALTARLAMMGGKEGIEQYDARVRRPDGTTVWCTVTSSLVRDDAGTPLYFMAQVLDIAKRRQAEADLAHQARHDALTGASNRIALHEALAAAAQQDRALMILDLERFGEINESLGHDVGDRVLTEIVHRLRTTTRPDDVVARIGGDEFAVLLRGVGDEERAASIARTLLTALEKALLVEGIALHARASIGISVAHPGEPDEHRLMRHADMAMCRAKRVGSGVAVYRASDDHDAAGRLALVADLRTAIGNDEIALHYQPKVAVASGQVVGVEALARWTHPTRGLVAPTEFIPLAEQTGLILPLTRHVLDVALGQCARWDAAGLTVGMSVNLSPRLLQDPDLTDWVRETLRDHHFAAERLTLEITEGALTEGSVAIDAMQALRGLGVKLSIDDLGTGYSSLMYLKSLPVDELKIDQGFIKELARDPRDEAIVRAIVDLGRRLGLAVVAEGVEDEESLAVLRRLNCPIAQGYHCKRPAPAEDLTPWLRERADMLARN